MQSLYKSGNICYNEFKEEVRHMLINRPEYMKFLHDWKDKQVIKVISGIRRCGKSTLFDMYIDNLKEQGVNDNQILQINFEDIEYEELLDYRKLYSYVKSRLVSNQMNYIFLDEIQHVKDYQKAVDSLFVQKNTDVYITGSNAYFMSGELATLLAGRYVELKLLPLSFKEYCSAFKENKTKEELYRNYLFNSSFPYTVQLEDRRNIHAYLDGIYNTVVLNDILARKNIQDPLMLKSVIKFMFDNIGNLCTIKKIADSMTNAGRKISSHTVENYLDGITESLLMYRVGRYDIKGKDYLQINEKYYLADLGLRYYLLGTKDVDQGRVLENIVFLELLRRGYEIYVGKYETTEVDFVVLDANGKIEYYQVALSCKDTQTLARELRPFNEIKDHYPKYLLTMDNDPPNFHNGVEQVYVLDWLLK